MLFLIGTMLLNYLFGTLKSHLHIILFGQTEVFLVPDSSNCRYIFLPHHFHKTIFISFDIILFRYFQTNRNDGLTKIQAPLLRRLNLRPYMKRLSAHFLLISSDFKVVGCTYYILCLIFYSNAVLTFIWNNCKSKWVVKKSLHSLYIFCDIHHKKCLIFVSRSICFI